MAVCVGLNALPHLGKGGFGEIAKGEWSGSMWWHHHCLLGTVTEPCLGSIKVCVCVCLSLWFWTYPPNLGLLRRPTPDAFSLWFCLVFGCVWFVCVVMSTMSSNTSRKGPRVWWSPQGCPFPCCSTGRPADNESPHNHNSPPSPRTFFFFGFLRFKKQGCDETICCHIRFLVLPPISSEKDIDGFRHLPCFSSWPLIKKVYKREQRCG